MTDVASLATAVVSLSDGKTYTCDGNVLSKLIAAACDTLDSDRNTAKACILQAAELLRVSRRIEETTALHVSGVRGGLAPWQKKRLVAYVEDNIGSNIRVVDLARVVRLSVGHFFRAFRESFAESPLAYVKRRRVRRSQALMLSSHAPLSQIALECGMCDQPHFTRLFRRIVGVNPGAWRRQFNYALMSAEGGIRKLGS
jgi:AraC family transcriptional regulator